MKNYILNYCANNPSYFIFEVLIYNGLETKEIILSLKWMSTQKYVHGADSCFAYDY